MTMRIAMFSDSFYPELGGIQDSILASARELGARGHQIILFAPAATSRDYARANRQPVEPDLGPNVRIRRLFSLPVPSSSQQSRIVVPTGRRWREAAAFRADIVHTQTFFGIGLEGQRAGRRLRLPLIGTNHWAVSAFDLYAPLARTTFGHLGARAVARFYRRCNWVTGPSRFTIEDLQANGLQQPCSVISNPIDTVLFHPVRAAAKMDLKSRLGAGGATIVYAGRLGREKRIEVLIHAVAAIRATLPDITLVLAGHGSARTALEALSHELGVNRQVRFAGTLNHTELAELFAAADLFAIASTSETQSMVLLQAMACGLPVVGARCGGLIEHIPPAVGLLAEPGNVDDFSEKLLRLLTAPRLREDMGQQARCFVDAFSVSSITDAWENLYARLVHDSRVETCH